MFCSKCGNQVDNNDKFCAVCGNPVESKPVDQTSESDATTVSEPVVADAGVQVNTNAVADAEPAVGYAVADKPKKKSKKWGILAIVAAFLVVVGIAGFVFWPNIENLAVKTFSDSASYYHFVENKNIDDIASTVGSLVSTVNTDTEAENDGASLSMKLKLGDLLLDYIANNGGVDKSDITWASEIGVNCDYNVDKKLSSGDVDILLGDKTLVGVDVVFDSEAGKIYIAVPQLNEKYVLIDFNEATGELFDSYEYEETAEIVQVIMEALPDEKTVTDLLTRYLTIAVESCDDVEEESDLLKANGVSQKCTKLTLSIDEDTVQKVIENILKEVKKDDDLEKILKEAMKTAGTGDVDEYYKEFISSVDELLDEVDEMELGNFEVKFISWVDSKGEVIGRELKSRDFEGKIYYYTAHDGKDVGVEVVFDNGEGDIFEVLGEGTVKGSKLNADYVVEHNDDKLLNINLKDYDVDLIEDNYVNGIFTFTATDSLCELLKDEANLSDEVVDAIKKLSVSVKVESSKEKGSVEVSAKYDDKLVASVSYSVESKKSSKVNLPSNYISADDDRAMEDYVSGITQDKIKKILTDAGVPKDVVDGLFKAIEDSTAPDYSTPDYSTPDYSYPGYGDGFGIGNDYILDDGGSRFDYSGESDTGNLFY